MTTQDYVFDNTRDETELVRLRAIEAAFDPATIARLESTGLAPGWRCLEIGPGAGSIMRWLAGKVAPTGHITAVEINPRFLGKGEANIDVIKADVREVDLEPGQFDLIHGRYVFLHIPGYQSLLRKVIGWLKPGGWIVLEEADFSAAQPIHGAPKLCRSVERVNRAIDQMYRDLGIDRTAGLKLPAIVQELGLDQLRVDNDAPIARGGSQIATIMRMSAEQLRDKYLATKAADADDVNAYCQFAEDPSTWAIYYATIAVTARQPNRPLRERP